MNYLDNFFLFGPKPADIMVGEYNLYLVLLSYVIATLASYVALDMSSHLRRPTTTLFRVCWLTGGAFVMGSGIWSMHFVGMLAFIMPMPMTYDLFWTGLSMLVASITAAAAFMFFMIKNPSPKQYLLSGIILGTAIPTMHYTGMAGMEDVKILYTPGWFILSILIAIVAACVALFLAVMSDKGSFIKRAQLKLISGMIMGIAICGMHYTGMAAAVFIPQHTPTSSTLSLDPKLMAIFITTTVISIMAIAIILSTSKYYVTTVLQKEKDFLEVVLDNIRGGVIASDSKGKINLFNKTVESLFGPISESDSYSENWIKRYPLFELEDRKPLDIKDYPLHLALAGNNIKDRELLFYDQEGNEKILIVDGQPLQNLEGDKVGAVIVYHDITERKQAETDLKNEIEQRELAQQKLYVLNKQLISAARRAGMAEIATSVLHNIGNIMNSVNVSALSLQEQLNETKFAGLLEIAKLIQEHKNDLNSLVNEHPKGKHIIDYLSKLSDFWEERRKVFIQEVQSINKNVQNINDIIIMQQSLSGAMGLVEKVMLNEVIDESIKLTHSTFTKANVKIVSEYPPDISIYTDKSKLLQIMVNLIRNAYEVVLESDIEDKIIIIRVTKLDDNHVNIQVIDNGLGIEKENLIKIFSYGFTTKKKGHGIGLHTSALTAKELGGSLTAESKGTHQGSTFSLMLPLKPSRRKEDKDESEKGDNDDNEIEGKEAKEL